MIKLQTEYIKLSQFIKYVGLANTGGEAKILLQNGEFKVTVNGKEEDKPGKKLFPGDIVVIDGRKFVVG